MTTLVFILLLVALQRVMELVLGTCNTRRLKAEGGIEKGARHYPLFILLHGSWLLAILLFTPACSRVPVGGQEADELHDHDERSGGGLGHAEPVQHLAGLEPVVGFDCLLRHVGEHGIGAAKGDNGHLGEEGADSAEGVVGAEHRDNRDQRHQPQ
jgi:hypothetical protein